MEVAYTTPGEVGGTDSYEYPYSIVWLATVPAILGILSVITIIGNTFVIAAFIKDRRIRDKVSNVIILNLSITDLLIGVFVLPVNTVYMSLDRWPFGEMACKVWLTLDYSLCTVSVITICLISLDRYWLVRKELKYASFQTRRRVAYTLACAWVTCVAFYATLAFGWATISGQDTSVDYQRDCEMEYSFSIPMTLAVNVVEFVIPLLAIAYLNLFVYCSIRKGPKGMTRQHIPSSTGGGQYIAVSSLAQVAQRDSSIQTKRPSLRFKFSSRNGRASDEERCIEGCGECAICQCCTCEINTVYKTRMKQHVQHRKAALLLAVLVGVFLVCWLPYQFTSIRFALCGDCVCDLTWEITNYLLWCNSTINPFLYALTNIRFKRNFQQFLCQCQQLCCRWKRTFEPDDIESELP